MVQKLHGTDRAARLNFVSWYLRGAYSVEIQPTILFSDDLRFLLNGYVKYPNIMLIHKVSLHGFKVVRYAVSVNRVTRDIFFWSHNSTPICSSILTQIYEHLSDYEKTYTCYQKVQKHIILFVVYIDFWWQCNKQGLWSPLSPAEPVQIYLWDTVKDKVYRDNFRIEDSLKAGVQNTVFWITPTKFNVQWTSVRRDAWLIAISDVVFENPAYKT